MATYTVLQGDCLSSIASNYGFHNWRTIYDHPGNEALKTKRPNPNQMYPGDEVLIPEKETKEVTRATGHTHVFMVNTLSIKLRLVVKDHNWIPFRGKRYELRVDSQAKPYSGVTVESGGTIEHPQRNEPEIQPDAKEAEVTIWLDDNRSRPPSVWRLKLGHLDPIEEITGVQQRLANLGFPIERLDDKELLPPAIEALMGFQSQADLEVTGNNDQKTKDALLTNHDRFDSKANSKPPVPFVTRTTGYAARLNNGSPPNELSATLSVQRLFRFSI
jgi:N-acetylmuramoyl-L-alanine amidase